MKQHQLVSFVLLQVADILETRFGPHPIVPTPQIKQIAADYINESVHSEDKSALIKKVNEMIDIAFKGS